jgi:peptidoglycan/LPS O-acetylase OafA/YrhL
LTADWWLGPHRVTPALVALGAAAVVTVALVSANAATVLNHHTTRWLGSRSFSLYLVHEPVVVTLGFMHALSPFPFVLVAVPASLMVAELFYRAVEHPAHDLSRMVRRRLRGHTPEVQIA